MNLETLKAANELKIKCDGFDRALECFTLLYGDKNQYSQTSNPSLIIEHDDYDDDREQAKIPSVISDKLVDIIKDYIVSERDKCKKEFDSL